MKLFSYKIKEKYLTIIAVLALAVSLLPLLRLACYSVPWYDDYNFMGSARGFSQWMHESYFMGALRTMRQEWYAWQGTYATTFLTALNPFIYGEQYQKVGIMAVILIFTVSVWVFCDVLLGNIFHAKRSSRWMIASVVAGACIGLIHTAQQCIYWYNAAVHYTMMPGIMFLMLAAVVKILYCKKQVYAALLMVPASVLGMIAAGSNYVTILQGLLVLLTILALGFLFKKKNTWFLIMPTVCFAIGFWLNVTAPGNSNRGKSYRGDGLTEAVRNSFVAAGKHFWEFTGPMMILMMILLVPVIWSMLRDTNFKFRLPGLVTLYSVCLYATGFSSSRFAMGTDGLSRTWVTIKFTLQILLFLNEIYWMGWIMNRKAKKGNVAELPHYAWYYALMACLAVGIFCTTQNQAGSYASYGAYYYVHTGEAYNFYHEYLERVEQLESDEQNLVFEPYHFRPWLLYRGDLSENPSAEQNIALANWYGKQSVAVKAMEE